MKKASNYVCTMSALNGNYVAVIAIIVVVILSLLLPDITQKFHATHELKNMKKVLAKMSVRITFVTFNVQLVQVTKILLTITIST